MKKLKPFLLSFVAFIFFDFIWLGFVMKDFNLKQLAEIGRIENGVFQMQILPAAATYVLMAFSVVFFILPKLNKQSSVVRTFLTGAAMGLVVYGVFDATNLAILKNYPLAFVAPDVAWGSFVFGVVTLITVRGSKAWSILDEVIHTQIERA